MNLLNLCTEKNFNFQTDRFEVGELEIDILPWHGVDKYVQVLDKNMNVIATQANGGTIYNSWNEEGRQPLNQEQITDLLQRLLV